MCQTLTYRKQVGLVLVGDTRFSDGVSGMPPGEIVDNGP